VEQVAEGYFSLLRWRTDPARDEARNVAVILVAPEGGFGRVRAAPISTISPRLRDQGLLDDVVLGLSERFERTSSTSLEELEELHGSLHRSLVISEPRPVAIRDPDEALGSLYRAYLAPAARGSRGMTKGALLDRVVRTLREDRHLDVKRGAYLNDFIFDAVIGADDRQGVLEVLSFAAARKDWTPIERDAGHFLYARQQLHVAAQAVIEPPTNGGAAGESFDRVHRWLERDGVPVWRADELADEQLPLELGQPVDEASVAAG
jgi:hypothetical protein